MQDNGIAANITADARSKSSTDEEVEGVFDVSKIKGKLAKRPPKGVGAAKKEKATKDKKINDSRKPKKVRHFTWEQAQLRVLVMAWTGHCTFQRMFFAIHAEAFNVKTIPVLQTRP